MRGTSRALVLVVDDDPRLGRMIGKVLEAEYRIAIAATGDDGLAQAVALEPDLILSDWLITCLSGERLSSAVRAHPKLGNVPFLMLTAHARARPTNECRQDYLRKPFSISDLRARVAIHITSKRAHARD